MYSLPLLGCNRFGSVRWPSAD